MAYDWHIMNKQEDCHYVVEWTYDNGGWVRVRYHNDIISRHKRCRKAKYALSLGEEMIDKIGGKR